MAPALDLGAPTPTEIAACLPVPRPYPGDPQTARFEVSSGYDPGQLLEQEDEKPRSVEIHLHNVRVLLDRNTGEDLERAQEELDTADSVPGPPAVRRWRLEWHRALLALRSADLDDDPRQVVEARRHFTRVHLELPGEYAPKLALAYCAERLGDDTAEPTAEELYEVVFARNPAHGGAALGLARLALRARDRRAAIEVLGRVRPAPWTTPSPESPPCASARPGCPETAIRCPPPPRSTRRWPNCAASRAAVRRRGAPPVGGRGAAPGHRTPRMETGRGTQPQRPARCAGRGCRTARRPHAATSEHAGARVAQATGGALPATGGPPPRTGRP
ncbi:tetratricopeptide repeat protein [Streptomyces sp. INA 01156]